MPRIPGKVLAVVLWAGIPFCGHPLRGQTPSIGEEPGHEQKQQRKISGKQADADQPIANPPIIVNAFGHEDSQLEAAEAEQEKHWKTKVDIWTISLAAIVTLFTGLLVRVGRSGVNAANRTLLAIEKQVALQEVAMTQWIEVKNWRCEPTALPDDVSLINQMTVSFDVENPTTFPLVIPCGNINFTLGSGTTRCFTGDGARLNPRQPQIKEIMFRMTEDQSTQYREGEVMVNVEGQLNFIDVIGKKQPHPVHGILWCSNRGVRFQSDVMWEHRVDDQKA
jgi:hypothetical protein